MFRILIVDDERIVLNGIRMMIEEELGLEFPVDIVTASHVPQAVALLDSFNPDLILTDIRMPVMDGFDLMRHVREKRLAVDIVILTSHADFGYAQQAIRFHVTDFILKPIDQQALKSTIVRLYQKKEEKEQGRRRAALLEVRNMMLYDLYAQELLCDSELIGQLFPHLYFTVIVLAFSDTGEGYADILREICLRHYDGCHCFYLQERGQLVAICNHKQFHTRPMQLQQEFAQASRCEKFWTGISISASSYKALHSLYTNALQRVFYVRHFGEGSVLTEISLFTYQDCVRILLENEETEAFGLLQEYLTKIRAASGKAHAPELIYQSFLHNILLYLENNHIYVPLERPDGACPAGGEGELASAILSLCCRIRRSIQHNQDGQEGDSLKKRLLAYLREHYREDVSLDDLAAHVGLHPNYICAVFKKNVGSSYLACLHRERLLEAKKLLLKTDLTMEQIADEVGYNSASQLARVFRKYEGMPPSAFRGALEERS